MINKEWEIIKDKCVKYLDEYVHKNPTGVYNLDIYDDDKEIRFLNSVRNLNFTLRVVFVENKSLIVIQSMTLGYETSFSCFDIYKEIDILSELFSAIEYNNLLINFNNGYEKIKRKSKEGKYKRDVKMNLMNKLNN